MNKAFKTKQLHKIKAKKLAKQIMKLHAGESCNFKDFYLADEILKRIEKGELVFS